MKHRFGDQFEQTVDCNWQAIPAIIGVVISAVGMIVSFTASQQAAQNAQAVANYNAMLQQRNAQIAYQLQMQQAQQAAAIAQNNMALAQQQAAVAAANQQYAQSRHDVEMQNVKILRDQANSIREQQREEARRMRDDSERRLGVMRAKYGASGVTFEGSPLVVLADAAQLAETQVQDKAYVSELEARKQFRAAEMTKYNADLTLAASTAQFGLDKYGAQIAQANYQTQLEAARYDTLIAGAKNKIALAGAELTRFEGGVQAQAYQAQGVSSLISGAGSMVSSAQSGISSYQNSQLLARSPGLYS